MFSNDPSPQIIKTTSESGISQFLKEPGSFSCMDLVEGRQIPGTDSIYQRENAHVPKEKKRKIEPES